MSSPEYKRGFGEKVWDYAVWGMVGVVALVAVIDILNHHIPLLEKTVGLVK